MTIKAVMLDFGDTLIHTESFDYDACLQKTHQTLTKNGVSVPLEEFQKSILQGQRPILRGS